MFPQCLIAHCNWKMPALEPNTLQGTNISHLGKKKIIFKSDFWWVMLVSGRVIDLQPKRPNNWQHETTPQKTQKTWLFLPPKFPTSPTHLRSKLEGPHIFGHRLIWFANRFRCFPFLFPNGHWGGGLLERYINLQKTPTEKWWKSQWYLTFSGEFHLIAILLWRTSFEKLTSTYSIGDLSRMTHDSESFSCTDGIWTSWTCDAHRSTKFDGSHLSHPPACHAFRTRSLSLRHSCRCVKPPPKRLPRPGIESLPPVWKKNKSRHIQWESCESCQEGPHPP